MYHSEDARHRFSEALDAALRGTVEVGALVLDNVRRASEAVLETRLDTARAVIEADDEIDEKYAALEQRVFEIMARQQPVAGDLRFLVSLTRILYDIERSGDLAVNCAKGLVRRDGYAMSPAIHSLLARMSRSAANLFHRGLEVLAALDPTAARTLDAADDELDTLVGEMYTAIAERSDDMGFDLALELSRVGRYMERIGDHAVNIAEHVTFIVTGEFPSNDEAEDHAG